MLLRSFVLIQTVHRLEGLVASDALPESLGDANTHRRLGKRYTIN